MGENIDKKPLVELITEITRLEQEIDIKILKYEKLRLEVLRRFPNIENQEVFKKKEKVYGKKI